MPSLTEILSLYKNLLDIATTELDSGISILYNLGYLTEVLADVRPKKKGRPYKRNKISSSAQKRDCAGLSLWFQ